MGQLGLRGDGMGRRGTAWDAVGRGGTAWDPWDAWDAWDAVGKYTVTDQVTDVRFGGSPRGNRQ